jgi:cysteine desulfurase
MNRRFYCDYNATAPLRPEARAAFEAALELGGNASSVHAEGRKARALVETAREQVAGSIGACRDDVIFVSGGTEAVQTPLRSQLRFPRTILVTSAIEHDAVLQLANHAEEWEVSSGGVVDLASLRRRVKDLRENNYTPLVSLMLVNNETGVIQPVAAAAEIVHAAGGLIHCDAVQGLGKTNVSVVDLDVDYLSLSAHKVGGPQGVGALYVKPKTDFTPLLTGGGQEFGRRAGTENVAGISAFGAAAEAAADGLAAYEALRKPRDLMEALLKEAAPDLKVHGEGGARVAGVSCFGVEGLPSETQIMGLDLAGFAVSAGSACSSGKVKPSRVLKAMGVSGEAAQCAIRASFGWATGATEPQLLAMAWARMASRARPKLAKALATIGGTNG